MNSENDPSAPIDLESLLPWTLTGRLSKLETARLRRAVEEGHLPLEALDESVRAFEIANERPDSATLTALAADDLHVDEATAVRAYLQRPEAAEDRELVELARAALTAETESTGPIGPAVPAAPRLWRAWAIAASLLAVLMAAGWWMASRAPSPAVPLVAEVAVAELLPDDMRLRGGDSSTPRLRVGPAGITLVLVVDSDLAARRLSVSLRDELDQEVARIDPVSAVGDGSVHILVTPQLAERTRRLVLFGTDPDALESLRIHEYSLEIEP